jgi:opacity protein-like surface antigen
MKKCLCLVASLSIFAGLALAQDVPWKRIEFDLLGGFGLSQAQPSSTANRNYSYVNLSSIIANNTISGEAKINIFLGGFMSFFFSPAIGVQAGIGYFNVDVPNQTAFNFSWSETTTQSLQASWDGTGRLTTIPLNLNVAAKLRMGRLEIFLSAGPALFINLFQATATAGASTLIRYSASHYDVDALPADLEIEETTWISFGGDAGAGIGLRLIDNLGIFMDARYYYCPKKDLSWTWLPGTYTGLRHLLVNVDTPADVFTSVQGSTTAYGVNPSLFRISGGIKILF